MQHFILQSYHYDKPKVKQMIFCLKGAMPPPTFSNTSINEGNNKIQNTKETVKKTHWNQQPKILQLQQWS